MTPFHGYKFLTAIEHQAFHEGLKAKIDAPNPYNKTNTPHASKAWSKGNQLAFRLNARIAVQYLNASKQL
ncbi:hypothetical protein HF888_13230 [Bermanella marisrubri]|uniref:Uncharacterized protein n=1 Tax=Bermanella marisrubri TaxID=207949 RepID=Q1N332_9GAMM|nr:hypothetical protein [Bermanella marisrubri]EAT12759.1 hypothetical protein RED65_13782 [Oceanobacter sp. RED65] [Bermanella marisrubri]QIZ85125.1 hypothetical protein HF888_13230 [Bermanella marisrubri]